LTVDAQVVARLAERYRAVGTAAVFSALEGMGAPTRLLALEIRPIRPDQVEVRPGDWIYGDLDGVIAIPPELTESVLGAAEQAEAREALIRQDFEAGMKVWDVYPKHRRL
jgi:regulator of RNase E activity RraA